MKVSAIIVALFCLIRPAHADDLADMQKHHDDCAYWQQVWDGHIDIGRDGQPIALSWREECELQERRYQYLISRPK